MWRLEIRARLRRLRWPEHGVHVEGVPFARDGARFTRDFEDLVAWLATKTDQTAVRRLVRIDWETIGRIIKPVVRRAYGFHPPKPRWRSSSSPAARSHSHSHTTGAPCDFTYDHP